MTVIRNDQETLLVIGDNKGVNFKDLSKDIWAPIKDESIDKAVIRCTLEYLHHTERIQFINKLYRVLKPDAKATFYVPFWSSPNAIADPFIQWPPITELSIYYLASKEFRDRNTPRYNEVILADFDINYGYSYNPNYHVRSDQARQWAVEHSIGIVTEMVFTLTKK